MEIFFSKYSKNQSYNQDFINNFAIILSLFIDLKGKKFQIIEILFESQTQIIHDLTKLLYLKTKYQIDKHI